MNKIIINAFGNDKPGLVFKITNVIKKYNGNIEVSKIIQLESDFTLLMLVEISLKNTNTGTNSNRPADVLNHFVFEEINYVP